MIKGIAQKIETLSDGSCKVSIYLPIESLSSVVQLANKDVYISLEPGEETMDTDYLLRVLRKAVQLVEAEKSEPGLAEFEGTADLKD